MKREDPQTGVLRPDDDRFVTIEDAALEIEVDTENRVFEGVWRDRGAV